MTIISTCCWGIWVCWSLEMEIFQRWQIQFLAKVQFMVLGLRDSQTPGLPDSGTPRLQDSQTPGLLDSRTPKLPDSQGVLGLGINQDDELHLSSG